ncbi:hypothetical protein PFDG_00860 [Plasmodium falciparum Dd2]|uniref:Rifin n=1 Tax=Plasmodium falciparum (isolate Dd2) TaxID=57267 RepID=A0A0L7LXI9_PLAF4|nr:hypothetical protein PFDG_00860 [Plasmodium falciparum Dd2]
MKAVMENYNRQTSDRFKEYDERMQGKRQKCKDKCDKEIQKIILKDKLEKELMDKFATLHTDIQSDAIPTCVCEKSLADKVEKNCMKCTQNLGGIVAPSSGVLAGIAEGALYAWKPGAIAAAMELAKQAGAAEGAIAGNAHGIKIVNLFLEGLGVEKLIPGISESIGKTIAYTNAEEIAKIIVEKYTATCKVPTGGISTELMCTNIDFNFGMRTFLGYRVVRGRPANEAIPQVINQLVGDATQGANAKATQVAATKTAAIEAAQEKAIETTFMGNQTIIIASVIAIVVIVLIMVIIYLILRYRRKKKMKKKLQYIKLLEE